MYIISILLVILLIFTFAISYAAMRYFINQIERTERIELDDFYDNKKLRQKFNVDDKINPLGYGMNYSEIEIEYNKLKLFGWFIDNKNTDKCIIISHGRGTNRLASLQYLELVKILELDKEHSIFIPDLRNAGKSSESRTYLGYGYAQDLYHWMLNLNEKYGKKKFILYAVSQGAMGSALATKLYNKQFKEKGIKIEKLILDSPISNSEKRIKAQAQARNIPKFIRSLLIRIFNIRVKGNLHKMKLSYLLRRVPVLILQAKNDKATPYGNLMYEYNKIASNKNVYLKVFDQGSHVRIYADNKKEYLEEVRSFLNKTGTETIKGEINDYHKF